MNRLRELGEKVKSLGPDYEGQDLMFRNMIMTMSLGSLLGLIVGRLGGNIVYGLYVYGIFILITLVLVLPSWPMYRRMKIKFVEEDPTPTEKCKFWDRSFMVSLKLLCYKILGFFSVSSGNDTEGSRKKNRKRKRGKKH